MKLILARVLLSIAVIAKIAVAEENMPAQFKNVSCEGFYPRHLQGIATNDKDSIFWSFTSVLVRTDLAGKVLKSVPVASHHGDLCLYGGKLYVAVNLGKFNKPAGEADSWVYVYDAETLKELSRHRIAEVVHGAGGIAWKDGRFMVVGGLPADINENYVYEYDESFVFQKKHVLASGYTEMGIQTVAYANDCWWFGCYGKPCVMLKADKDLKFLGSFKLDCSLGIVGLKDGRFLVAQGDYTENKGFTGRIMLGVADEKLGLRVLDAESAK